MRKIGFYIWIICVILNCSFSIAQIKKSVAEALPKSGIEALSLHFKNPPTEYSIIPFWSLNNTLDSTKLKWQIDQMLDKGVFGAFMHAREGLDQSATPYFSENWWAAIESTVKYAHEKGFYTHLYDEDKWPSGSAGGRTIEFNPERNIKKILKYNDFQVSGPQTLQLNFANNPLAIYAGKINERGVYDFSTQIDLTPLAGKEWKMPAGRWAIISFTMIKDPAKQINYMDSSTVADFIHITHDEYFKRLGPYFGNTIPGVFFDEIYANSSERRNNIFWSDDFTEQFKKIKGYDLKPNLPLIILNDPSLSPKIRYDFFDVVRILYGNAWFTQYAKWASDHKIWVTGHTTEELIQHIRQSDYFFTEGQLQVPCTDNEDFRYGFPRAIDFYNPKQISSLGHIYGKQRMAAEAMGGGGYTIPLEDYRYGFSMLGIYGVNMFIPHLFHYSMERPENQNDWPPSWFYQNPYWKYFKPLANYAQRISYMISQGKHVCKVAVVYPLTQVWLGGYTTPIDDELYREVQQILLNNHIDYDIIDPYTLAKATSNKDGLFAGDEQYQALILPGLKAIQTDCLISINEFVSKGGLLIAVKELPSASEKGTPLDPFVIGSMNRLFGFEPREINQIQYHTLDAAQKDRVLVQSNTAGGKGVFTRYTEELPKIIRKNISTDILIEGEANEWIKYQHRKVANTSVYYFMNSHKEPGSFVVSVSDIGKPTLWNPETGEISPVNNYRINDSKLQFILDCKPWESYFIVIEPEKCLYQNKLLVTHSDLKNTSLINSSGKIIMQGWVTGKNLHEVDYLLGNEGYTKKWQTANSLPLIPIKSNWDFQICPNSLNNIWASHANPDTLALPLMKFKAAINREWKTIKIEDKFNNDKGSSRYLSNWDAYWISFYDNSMHLPEIVGGVVYFKKEVSIDGAVKNASLDITADESYELFINGKWVGKNSNWKTPVQYNIQEFIKIGVNHILVKTNNTKGLLLQGSVSLENGSAVSFFTDQTWLASKDQLNWLPAIKYASPPLGLWGKIIRPDQAIQFPLIAEYKQVLPPGTETIKKPNISGQYQLFVNDQAIDFTGEDAVFVKPYLKAESNILSVRIKLEKPSDGIQTPLQITCGKASVSLGSWTDNNLDWYSGRAIYTHTVQIDSAYCKLDKKMILDLGKVNFFAEIWINDQLVTYRPWPPFSADISHFIHPGKNKITIVVANLLANEASWSMLDANIDTKEGRWWNYGSIMREKEKLISGLLGPVQLIPYSKESVEISNDKNKIHSK